MKSEHDIIKEIESLEKQQDKLYNRKKRAKDNSGAMRYIDSQIDKNGARIRALEWVVE